MAQLAGFNFKISPDIIVFKWGANVLIYYIAEPPIPPPLNCTMKKYFEVLISEYEEQITFSVRSLRKKLP